MSPASYHFTEGRRSKRSSEAWKNSGIMRRGECLTLNLPEWTATLVPFPNDGAVSSLSDILVTGDIPRKFFLSQKACAGILRRAGIRGKAIPETLRQALSAVAGEPNASEKVEDRTTSLPSEPLLV